MNHLKIFEKYTQKDIDKKYYVWKAPAFPEHKIGVIEILNADTENIKYVTLRRTDWRGRDFFTSQRLENKFGDLVTLKKWKRDKYNILFETDIEIDALDFYNIYNQYGKIITKDNWELYRDANKYNI